MHVESPLLPVYAVNQRMVMDSIGKTVFLWPVDDRWLIEAIVRNLNATTVPRPSIPVVSGRFRLDV